jgi:PTH1 family peptidyl-tRNA hydrolase
MAIKLVAGLGNPGLDYAPTRHNLGWVVIDALARKHRLTWRIEAHFQAELARWDSPSGARWLVKPLTFMNESGVAVGSVARFLKLPVDSIAAAYDDVGLEFGRVKISVAGGDGGHNGVASLLQQLGEGFARYRLGIGPRLPLEIDLKDFVLSKFSSEQLTIIENKLESYVCGLELLLDRGADRAMNELNRKDPS